MTAGRIHKSLCVLAFSSFVAVGIPAAATQATVGGSTLAPFGSSLAVGPNHVPGELLVKFKTGVGIQTRTQSIQALGLQKVRAVDKSQWLQVELPAGLTVAQALTAYAADPNVEYVQPNYIYRAAAAPTDPQYGQLWAFSNTGQVIGTGSYTPNSGTAGADMNIELAWDHVNDCTSVVVAVLDTGVKHDQEDLAANMWTGNAKHGWDFIDGDDDPMDLNGHGTHVAGIIGAEANNGNGVAGVCWQASIMAVRVLGVTGNGTTSGIIQGIDFAVDNGAKVINMSLGGSGPFDQAFSDAISNARSKDVVVVVAAGNSALDNDVLPTYPCSFTQANLICVAALGSELFAREFLQLRSDRYRCTTPEHAELPHHKRHLHGIAVRGGARRDVESAEPAVHIHGRRERDKRCRAARR